MSDVVNRRIYQNVPDEASVSHPMDKMSLLDVHEDYERRRETGRGRRRSETWRASDDAHRDTHAHTGARDGVRYPGLSLVRAVPTPSEPCSGRALCQFGQADEVVSGHCQLRPTSGCGPLHGTSTCDRLRQSSPSRTPPQRVCAHADSTCIRCDGWSVHGVAGAEAGL